VFYRALACFMLMRRARPKPFEGAAPDDGTAVMDAVERGVSVERGGQMATTTTTRAAETAAAAPGRERVPIRLEWRDMSVSVPQEQQEQGARPSRSCEVILSGVSGSAAPGRLTFVMGPSGSGKTTLLQCLAGKNWGGLRQSGQLSVNGEKLTAAHGRLFAFMFQEDLFPDGLTVVSGAIGRTCCADLG
jgi:ABC-type sulfate/molybdate transport systems ATPase subunit